MSTIDQFWSFRQVLRGRRSRAIEDGADQGAVQPVSVPFVAGRKGSGGTGLQQYYEDLDDVDTPIQAPLRIQEEPIKFVYPTSVQLDDMSLKALHRLRRNLALEVHPDRNPDLATSDQGEAMARCNRLIDDAIQKKKFASSR